MSCAPNLPRGDGQSAIVEPIGQRLTMHRRHRLVKRSFCTHIVDYETGSANDAWLELIVTAGKEAQQERVICIGYTVQRSTGSCPSAMHWSVS